MYSRRPAARCKSSSRPPADVQKYYLTICVNDFHGGGSEGYVSDNRRGHVRRGRAAAIGRARVKFLARITARLRGGLTLLVCWVLKSRDR